MISSSQITGYFGAEAKPYTSNGNGFGTGLLCARSNSAQNHDLRSKYVIKIRFDELKRCIIYHLGRQLKRSLIPSLKITPELG